VFALVFVVPVASATVFHANELYDGGGAAAFVLEVSPDLYNHTVKYQFGVVNGAYKTGDKVLAIAGLDSLRVKKKGDDWLIKNRAGNKIDITNNAFSFVFLVDPTENIWEADTEATQLTESIYSLSFPSFPEKYDFLALNVTSADPTLAQPIPPAFALFGSVLAGGAFLSRKRLKGGKA
jgi:hypothetical protein